MSQVIKINAITVPADSGDELAHRFAARAGAVDDQDGLRGLRAAAADRRAQTWLVVTRWRDEESFQAWVAQPGLRPRPPVGADRAGGDARRPVSVSSELWSYEVAGGSPASG